MHYTKCSYRGEKINNRIEGRGKFTFANGNQYIGQFTDGMFHGKGTVYFTQKHGGGKYKAQWDNGIAQGGTYFFADGLKYKPGDWDYCTPQDRRFWREHNSFIVPPLAGPLEDTIIPDYSEYDAKRRKLTEQEAAVYNPVKQNGLLDSDDEATEFEDVNYEATHVEGDPHQLAFMHVPVNLKADVPFKIVIEVRDYYGNRARASQDEVTLACAEGTAAQLRLSTPSVVTEEGMAIFEDVVYPQSGIFSLVATSPSLKSAVSIPLEATPVTPKPVQDASSLAMYGVPSSVTVGGEFSLTVELQDDAGRLVPSAGEEVTLSVGQGKGTLEGTLSQTPTSGRILFYDLAYNGTDPFKITAKCGSLPPLTCKHLITPIAEDVVIPEKLVFVDLPPRPARGLPFAFGVAVQDMNGRLATTCNGTDVELLKMSGKGTLICNTPEITEGGYALFNDVVYTGSDPFVLVATADGLQSATQIEPLIPEAVPIKLGISRIMPLQTDPGEPFQIVVEVQDLVGGRVPDAKHEVLLSLYSGNGRLFGTTTAKAHHGEAFFTDVRYDGPDNFTLVASDPTGQLRSSDASLELYSGTEIKPLPFTCGPAAQLSIMCLPTDPPMWSPFSIVVEIQDKEGRKVPYATNPIDAEVLTGTGTLTGTYPIHATGGEAIFTDLVYDLPEPFTLQISSPGLQPAVTQAMTSTPTSSEKSSTTPRPKPFSESPKDNSNGNHLAFTNAPVGPRLSSNVPFDIQVAVLDKNDKTHEAGMTVVSLGTARGRGKLEGKTAVITRGGVAEFRNLTYSADDIFQIQAKANDHRLKSIVGPELTYSTTVLLATAQGENMGWGKNAKERKIQLQGPGSNKDKENEKKQKEREELQERAQRAQQHHLPAQDENAAATRLQASWRGHNARKNQGQTEGVDLEAEADNEVAAVTAVVDRNNATLSSAAPAPHPQEKRSQVDVIIGSGAGFHTLPDIMGEGATVKVELKRSGSDVSTTSKEIPVTQQPPVWNEKVGFEAKPGEMVNVRVIGKDQTGEETVIGSATIPCDATITDQNETASIVPLDNGGCVHLAMVPAGREPTPRSIGAGLKPVDVVVTSAEGITVPEELGPDAGVYVSIQVANQTQCTAVASLPGGTENGAVDWDSRFTFDVTADDKVDFEVVGTNDTEELRLGGTTLEVKQTLENEKQRAGKIPLDPPLQGTVNVAVIPNNAEIEGEMVKNSAIGDLDVVILRGEGLDVPTVSTNVLVALQCGENVSSSLPGKNLEDVDGKVRRVGWNERLSVRVPKDHCKFELSVLGNDDGQPQLQENMRIGNATLDVSDTVNNNIQNLHKIRLDNNAGVLYVVSVPKDEELRPQHYGPTEIMDVIVLRGENVGKAAKGRNTTVRISVGEDGTTAHQTQMTHSVPCLNNGNCLYNERFSMQVGRESEISVQVVAGDRPSSKASTIAGAGAATTEPLTKGGALAWTMGQQMASRILFMDGEGAVFFAVVPHGAKLDIDQQSYESLQDVAVVVMRGEDMPLGEDFVVSAKAGEDTTCPVQHQQTPKLTVKNDKTNPFNERLPLKVQPRSVIDVSITNENTTSVNTTTLTIDAPGYNINDTISNLNKENVTQAEISGKLDQSYMQTITKVPLADNKGTMYLALVPRGCKVEEQSEQAENLQDRLTPTTTTEFLTEEAIAACSVSASLDAAVDEFERTLSAQSGLDERDREEQAATKIQAVYRGSSTRKGIKPKLEPNQQGNKKKKSSADAQVVTVTVGRVEAQEGSSIADPATKYTVALNLEGQEPSHTTKVVDGSPKAVINEHFTMKAIPNTPLNATLSNPQDASVVGASKLILSEDYFDGNPYRFTIPIQDNTNADKQLGVLHLSILLGTDPAATVTEDEEKEEAAAATKIQALYKGRITRKEQDTKKSATPDDTKDTQPDLGSPKSVSIGGREEHEAPPHAAGQLERHGTMEVSQEDLDHFRAKFRQIDHNQDGYITRDEVDRLYRTIFIELSEAELDGHFAKLDKDNSGQVDFHEFVKAQQVQRALKVRELGKSGEARRRSQFKDDEKTKPSTEEFDYTPGMDEAKEVILPDGSVHDSRIDGGQLAKIAAEIDKEAEELELEEADAKAKEDQVVMSP